jgi:GDP-L-fucose synthase
MKILLTGGKSFLAKELTSYFSKDHTVITTNRNSLDPTDYENVKAFFKHVEVDVLIHTAIKGGKRNHPENVMDLYDNLSMFHNLQLFSDKYKVMFNFGSGAEFDRSGDINIAREEDVFGRCPSEYYGLSKNLITRRIVRENKDIYNLRLFGCFGINEEPQRLLRGTYSRFANGESAVVHQDKYMDYFYAQDIGRVIEYISMNNSNEIPRDINLCYRQKYKLSELVYKIKCLSNAKNDVIIEDTTLALSYTGASDKLENLNIPLIGVDNGIKECLKNWNKS